MREIHAFFLLALSLWIPVVSSADDSSITLDVGIPHFEKIKDGMYRGGRPNSEGLRYLSKIGVVTVIDLENDSRAVSAERSEAGSLGLTFISLPMSAYDTVSEATVNRALALLQREDNQPLFIHCKHGQDRTGLIVGIYRVETDGWSANKAYQEMLRIGFHKSLVDLDDYFRERTGL